MISATKNFSYKPFSDFEKQAGIVAFNFNYNSERFGGFIFKILIPHVLICLTAFRETSLLL